MIYSDFLKEEALVLDIADWPSDRAVRMLIDRLNAKSRATIARHDRLMAQVERQLGSRCDA